MIHLEESVHDKIDDFMTRRLEDLGVGVDARRAAELFEELLVHLDRPDLREAVRGVLARVDVRVARLLDDAPPGVLRHVRAEGAHEARAVGGWGRCQSTEP